MMFGGEGLANTMADVPNREEERAMSKILTWKQINQRFVNGESGWLGSARVCTVIYDGSTGDNNKYALNVLLPGHGKTKTHYEIPEDAKSVAENIIKAWLELAQLRVK